MAARRGQGQLRVEPLRRDEQPGAQAVGPDPIATGRDAAGRLRTSAAARALALLPRRTRFVPRQLACDAKFEPHNANRLAWLKGRTSEHHAAHGGVSRGVGSMLNAAGWLYAGGEFTAERAAETGDPELFKVAATLTSTARQHELAAWELGAREAEARRKANPAADLSKALADARARRAAAAQAITTAEPSPAADATTGQPDALSHELGRVAPGDE